MTEEEVREIIREQGEYVTNLLIEKNKAYGNSAISPKRFFSKADMTEQIKVRIDDKLNRLVNGLSEEDEEDVVLDLIGYLVLLRVAQIVQERENTFTLDMLKPKAKQEDLQCSCKNVNMGFLHLRGAGCDL